MNFDFFPFLDKNIEFIIIVSQNLTLSWIDQAFPKDKETNITTHLQKMTKNLIIEFKAFLEDEYTLKQAQEIYKEYMSNRR